jgi:hypothetical protein
VVTLLCERWLVITFTRKSSGAGDRDDLAGASCGWLFAFGLKTFSTGTGIRTGGGFHCPSYSSGQRDGSPVTARLHDTNHVAERIQMNTLSGLPQETYVFCGEKKCRVSVELERLKCCPVEG